MLSGASLMAWLIRLCGRLSGILALMLLVEFLAFLLYRVFRYGYAIAPWQTDADKRFGSKNFEPPIELRLSDPDEKDKQ